MTSARMALSAVGLLALTSPVFAQNLPPGIIACAIERKDSTRLDCFDRQVARLVQQSASVAPAPSVAAPAMPAAPPVAATPLSAPPMSAPVSPGANTSADEFGMSGEMARKRRDDRKEAPPPSELRAAVSKVSQKPYGEYILELDNGQVWEQPEKKNTFVIKQGENVRITRGALGSFFLTTDSGASTKVRRIR